MSRPATGSARSHRRTMVAVMFLVCVSLSAAMFTGGGDNDPAKDDDKDDRVAVAKQEVISDFKQATLRMFSEIVTDVCHDAAHSADGEVSLSDLAERLKKRCGEEDKAQIARDVGEYVVNSQAFHTVAAAAVAAKAHDMVVQRGQEAAAAILRSTLKKAVTAGAVGGVVFGGIWVNLNKETRTQATDYLDRLIEGPGAQAREIAENHFGKIDTEPIRSLVVDATGEYSRWTQGMGTSIAGGAFGASYGAFTVFKQMRQAATRAPGGTFLGRVIGLSAGLLVAELLAKGGPAHAEGLYDDDGAGPPTLMRSRTLMRPGSGGTTAAFVNVASNTLASSLSDAPGEALPFKPFPFKPFPFAAPLHHRPAAYGDSAAAPGLTGFPNLTFFNPARFRGSAGWVPAQGPWLGPLQAWMGRAGPGPKNDPGLDEN